MKTSRRRGSVVLDLGLALLPAAIVVTVVISVAARIAAPQTPAPTEQQAAEALITSSIAWTERIGPAGRDWNQSQRRAMLGSILCAVAETLNSDPAFAAQQSFACEALRVYFPEIDCWACEN